MKFNFIVPLLVTSAGLTAVEKDPCPPEPAAPCYNVDTWACDYCLGPDVVNPAVRPTTCDGDFVLTLAGFVWNARQDGLEYAIRDNVLSNVLGENPNLTNLIDAKLLNPKFKWNLGFKFGVGFNTNYDGWDLNVLWTTYQGRAHSLDDADSEDRFSLIPLWSALQTELGEFGPTLIATYLKTHWKLQLNLVDVELGREFWLSKYLTMRPHIGLRFASLNQHYELNQRGESWAFILHTGDEIDMKNNFKGVGVRAGLDTLWHIGRGFAFYGNAALAIVYGRFDIDYDEDLRLFESPFFKIPMAEYSENFRASRGMTDLSLGLQWSTRFSNCEYGFILAFGWEQHLFFNQNQLWRVQRVLGDFLGPQLGQEINQTGENVFNQRRGDLSTQGWTLRASFYF